MRQHIRTSDINDDIERVETGALKINDDWTGLFVRGDQCFELMLILERILIGSKISEWNKLSLRLLYDEIFYNVGEHGSMDEMLEIDHVSKTIAIKNPEDIALQIGLDAPLHFDEDE